MLGVRCVLCAFHSTSCLHAPVLLIADGFLLLWSKNHLLKGCELGAWKWFFSFHASCGVFLTCQLARFSRVTYNYRPLKMYLHENASLWKAAQVLKVPGPGGRIRRDEIGQHQISIVTISLLGQGTVGTCRNITPISRIRASSRGITRTYVWAEGVDRFVERSGVESTTIAINLRKTSTLY